MPADATFSGRSMVEMLGVLAIIGVLSVGAIAGYSKAMMKYKLNKHAEALNALINYGLQYKDKFERIPQQVTRYNQILFKLNMIPEGISYVSENSMKDMFNNTISVFYNNGPVEDHFNDFGGLSMTFAASPQGAEICRNVVNVAKENSADLWQVETYKGNSDNSTTIVGNIYVGNIYGDNYCGKSGLKCLSKLSLSDLDALCNICDDQTCTLYILWK